MLAQKRELIGFDTTDSLIFTEVKKKVFARKIRADAKRNALALAALNPIATSAPRNILAIDLLGGKTSLPTRERSNKYLFTMVDLFTRFGIATPMPDQTAQTALE